MFLSRFEAEVYNCLIRGEIPHQIDGTYYRVMPDAVSGTLNLFCL